MKDWILMVVFYIAMVAVNALGGTGNINGQSQADISDKLTVLFTPDGYVFSIWGLIYVLVAIWLIIQVRHVRTREEVSPAMTSLFIATCIFNILWIFMWHYEVFVVAQIMMFALLISLLLLYTKFPAGDHRFGGRLPFSIYTGWISVATIANMAYTLKHYEVDLGIGEVPGTIGLIVVAVLLALLTLYRKRDPLFALVFVWALIGIGTVNTENSLVIAAFVAAAIIGLAAIASIFTRKKAY